MRMGVLSFVSGTAVVLLALGFCVATKDSDESSTDSTLDSSSEWWDRMSTSASSSVAVVDDMMPGEDDDGDEDNIDEDRSLPGDSDGVPADRNPRYCNKSTTFTLKTECKPCGMNSLVACPSGLRQLTQGRGLADCTFAQRLDFISVIYVPGCRHTCEKTATIALCCSGFWGQDCQECPGGFQMPCGGHGRCLDGYYSNGTCICQAGFMGVACELCKPNIFGLQCNKECQCVNGICDNGINGTGSCDCNSGYKGTFCEDSVLNCDALLCPNNSRCVSSEAGVKCVCNHGYEEEEVEDKVCQPINRCLANPRPCHSKALCFPTGPATFECSCMLGYDGDGFTCSVNDPCQKNFGDCPVDSTSCTFIGPGQRTCECLEGFQNYTEVDGCQLIDACVVNSTLCHENANCTTTGPWEVECVCATGYIGDGQNCYGNIFERIKSLHASDPEFKDRFQYAVQMMSNIYTDALTQHGPFTVFLATDEGIRKSLTTHELQDVFADKDIARQLVRQHIIAAQLTLADLTNATAFYMLEGSSAELFYKNKELKFRLHNFNLKANVIKGDLIAANGIIHVIDQLLDKPPVTAGSNKKSIAYILSTQPRYSKLYSLLQAVNLTEKLAAEGHYTVFAPTSIAWNSLPKRTFDYFLSTEGKGKLIEILENHIISGPYSLASDLINMPRIATIGGVANEVTVTSVGRILFNGAVNLTQADVPASNGYIHSIDGILLPEALLPILPHRCDLVTYREVRGTCGMCSRELKCPWISDVPLDGEIPGCRYWVNLGDGRLQNYVAFSGCHKMCNRTYTVIRCCQGFYGPTCHPCPGGFQNPCLGRGKCRDGYYGSGECTCDPSYYGAECEFCANKNMYGPNCNQSCSCLHGSCDNRVSESVGSCKPNSCTANYTGINCDIQTQFCNKKLKLKCHVFADCVRKDFKSTISSFIGKIGETGVGRRSVFIENLNRLKLRNLKKLLDRRASCTCRQGYRGSGTYCVEINPCLESDRGGCHMQADCIKTGPGQNLCRCSKGWVGDGNYCYPSSPCQNDSHCHENAICIMKLSGEYACTCMDGYHGNGTYCIAENICSESNGGCHSNASCTANGPGLANCVCDSGLGGDGYSCYGSIANEIRFQPQLQHLGLFLEGPQTTNNPLQDLESNYTLLAPSQQALSMFLNSTSVAFWNDENNLKILLSYHILLSAMTLSDLRLQCSQEQKLTTLSDDEDFELRCSVKEEDIYFNDAKVIAGDNPALNGLIHIIDKVLEPFSSIGESLPLREALQKWSKFSDFAASLADTGLIEDIEMLSSFTIFVPMDSDWQTPNSKRTLQYYVVPSKLSTWKLRVTNEKRLATTAGNSVQQQLIVTIADDKLYINDVLVVEPSNVAVANGFIHAINGSFQPILNRCDMVSSDKQLEEHCCSGYYGFSCEECPGGAENACSGHGICDDGIEGQGFCQCSQGYGGDACDTCVEEICRIDVCKIDNGGCHEFADCDVTDEGTSMCTCRQGYVGNGLICLSLCDDGNKGGCHFTAQCRLSEFGDVLCVCPDGHQMLDKECTYTANDCLISNGGCSSHGNCSQADDTDNITCMCLEGFIGDGYSCFGSLWQTLSDLPEISYFFRLVQDDPWLAEALQDPNSSWTAFVPLNKYLMLNNPLMQLDLRESFTNETIFFIEPEFIERDVVLQAVNQDELRISCNKEDKGKTSYYVNGIAVIRKNIRMTNGVLHIMERPFKSGLFHHASAADAQLQERKVVNPWLLAFLLIAASAILIFAFAVAFRNRKSLQIRINQLLLSGRFPFQRFTERGPSSQSYDVFTFNPMATYEEQEECECSVAADDMTSEMQQTGRDDHQQLL